MYFVEAHCFQEYLSSGNLISISKMEHVKRDEYLGGVIDFTGRNVLL